MKQEHGVWQLNAKILTVAIFAIIAATLLALRIISCHTEPTEPRQISSQSLSIAHNPTPEAVIDTTQPCDLFILGNDSLGLYQDFGGGHAGLRAGDWIAYGGPDDDDSLQYQCPVGNKGPGQFTHANGYQPGFVTVAVFYEGKRFDNYYSKTSFDLGNTNCLAGVTPVQCDHTKVMCLTPGCIDVYYPKVFVKPFTQGDKLVILGWVNKGGKFATETDSTNNYQVLPLRKDTTYFDPAAGVHPKFVLDWSAMSPKNVSAIRRYLRKS